MSEDIFSKISEYGIVPLITLDDPNDAVPLAHALIEGGIPIAEVTFRTSAGGEAIKRIAKEVPELIVGAGTVHDIDHAKETLDNGGQFVITPGFNREVVDWCVKNNMPVCPGVVCPSDIEEAMSFGLKTLKFFPAEQAGGIAMIKAMSAPYTQMKFMPTGGVNAQNLNTYLASDKVLACGGSWMVKKELIASGQFDKIRQLTKEAVETMLGFRLKHIGINCQSADEAEQTAGFFERLFGFAKDPRDVSFFAGTAIEAMNSKGRGTMGHIAIGANSVERARNYLEMLGCQFDESTAKYENGKLTFIYIAGEVSGFAVHLTQN